MSDSLTLADVMSSPVVTVRDDATVWEAMQRFIASGLRHLVVVSPTGTYRGVLSDRTLLGQWPFDPARMHGTPVGSLLPNAERGLAAGSSLHDGAVAMRDSRVDAVAVVDAVGHPIGIVTGGDLLRAALMAEQESFAS